jgi:hypothetical protein
MNWKKIYKPPIVQEWTALLREKGIKEFLRLKGWKILAAIFVFYLIRDSILYVIIPFWVAQGFICGK